MYALTYGKTMSLAANDRRGSENQFSSDFNSTERIEDCFAPVRFLFPHFIPVMHSIIVYNR